MPNPWILTLFAILSTIATLMILAIAQYSKSPTVYRVALGNAYVTEIAIVFLVFVLFINSPYSPFTYNEQSNLKVFLDFFTVYQISIFIFFKTLDSITDRPFQNYLVELKRVNLCLAAKSWKRLIKEYDNLQTENPKHHYHEFFHLKRTLLSLKIYLFLSKANLSGFLDENLIYLRTLSNEQLNKLIEAGKKDDFEDSLLELQEYISTEILESELLSEQQRDQWSGSIVLRLAYRNKPNKIQYKLRNFFNKVIKPYIFVIFNLIIMLVFMITYHYFNIRLFYY